MMQIEDGVEPYFPRSSISSPIPGEYEENFRSLTSVTSESRLPPEGLFKTRNPDDWHYIRSPGIFLICMVALISTVVMIIAAITHIDGQTKSGFTFDWKLSRCCIDVHYYIIIYAGTSLFMAAMLWDYTIIRPLKLLCIILHEVGHATSCWLSGGSVIGIEINIDKGAATLTQGGKVWLILPSGYSASIFWGSFFFIMSTINPVTLMASAGLLGFSLLLVMLISARTWSLRCLCLVHLAVITALILVYIVINIIQPLQAYSCFFGVLNAFYAVWDVWDDLLYEKIHESDASKFAYVIGASIQWWSSLWGLMSLVFFGFTVYVSLVFH